MAKIKVQNTEITIVSHNDDDYISLTDMARSQLQEHIIFRWPKIPTIVGQGIPTTESRRTKDVRLDSKKRAIQNQLPYLY